MENSKNSSVCTENSSVTAIFTMVDKLKKYFVLFLVMAISAGVLSFAYSGITTVIKPPELKALIGFSYDGIDKGLDPNGRKFDINTVKSPAVIEMALTELNIDIEKLESIRNGITFEKIIPASAYDKFTVYNSILEKGGQETLEAGEKLIETSYYPTQFTVLFDYSKTGFSKKKAAEVFNMIIEKYDEYFYKTYGYNEAIGNAVSAISYEDYDYAEAVDVFENNLSTLKRYVKQLSDEDDTRFRSTVTGYTLADLYSSIDTVQTIDLDKISSYITFYNVTKDKERAIAYYEYRIDALTREVNQYEEQIEVYDGSIKSYEKDQVLVFGGTDNINTQSNVSSEQYDKMFSQKNNTAEDLAYSKQRITFYKNRIQALKSNNINTNKNIEMVESELKSLNEKLNTLIELVRDTSEDYYRNVTFGNAYNILVPASGSAVSILKTIFNNALIPLLILEVIAFFVYFAIAFVAAFAPKKGNGKKISENETDKAKV